MFKKRQEKQVGFKTWILTIFASILALKILSKGDTSRPFYFPKTRPRCPQDAPRHLQDASKTPQDASNTPLGSPKTPPSCLKLP